MDSKVGSLPPKTLARQLMRYGLEVVLASWDSPAEPRDQDPSPGLLPPKVLAQHLIRYGFQVVRAVAEPKAKPKKTLAPEKGVRVLAGFTVTPPKGKGRRWGLPYKTEIQRKAQELGMSLEEIAELLPSGVKPTNEEKFAALEKIHERTREKKANSPRKMGRRN